MCLNYVECPNKHHFKSRRDWMLRLFWPQEVRMSLLLSVHKVLWLVGGWTKGSQHCQSTIYVTICTPVDKTTCSRNMLRQYMFILYIIFGREKLSYWFIKKKQKKFIIRKKKHLNILLVTAQLIKATKTGIVYKLAKDVQYRKYLTLV